jgi:protein-L-isoaspartate O-methyltransferase
VNWEKHARRLAAQVTHPASRWRPVIASVPRHVFVPRWWTIRPSCTDDVWELHDGPADEHAWAQAAYGDRSLVTRVGPLHADHTEPGDHPAGRPTSSSTLPGLIVQMFRHGYLSSGLDVLEVGTGSGYGCAVLATRLGDDHVTSIDVDEYLTTAASERLDTIGLHPQVATVDAASEVPGTYDRIIATVAVRPIPASWLSALRPGGRLVTTIASTALILTADKTRDGGAAGRIEWDRAGFMHTRTGPDYPPHLRRTFPEVFHADGEQVGVGRYPVTNIVEAWEIWSMLGVLAPGIEYHYSEDGDVRTQVMLHPDGSWARASGRKGEAPTVHQAGPRRLWDIVDNVRHQWLSDGSLPLYGAKVRIEPDGLIRLTRGRWQVTIAE